MIDHKKQLLKKLREDLERTARKPHADQWGTGYRYGRMDGVMYAAWRAGLVDEPNELWSQEDEQEANRYRSEFETKGEQA